LPVVSNMTDMQRLVRGAVLIAQELYRHQHGEISRASRLLQHHV